MLKAQSEMMFTEVSYIVKKESIEMVSVYLTHVPKVPR